MKKENHRPIRRKKRHMKYTETIEKCLRQGPNGVRVTFLRGENDAKDGWERADGNQQERRSPKQAEETQVWGGEEKPTGPCAG
jgi:hypothetical protein